MFAIILTDTLTQIVTVVEENLTTIEQATERLERNALEVASFATTATPPQFSNFGCQFSFKYANGVVLTMKIVEDFYDRVA